MLLTAASPTVCAAVRPTPAQQAAADRLGATSVALMKTVMDNLATIGDPSALTYAALAATIDSRAYVAGVTAAVKGAQEVAPEAARARLLGVDQAAKSIALLVDWAQADTTVISETKAIDWINAVGVNLEVVHQAVQATAPWTRGES